MVTNQEQSFNSIYDVASCGVSMQDLSTKIGHSDKFYQFKLQDDVKEDQLVAVQEKRRNGITDPFLRYVVVKDYK